MQQKYKNQLRLWIIVLGTVMSSFAFGQTEVSGTVTTQQNEPLPGVNVLVKGTTQGTTTDANGQFRLNIADKNTAVLTFSFIGYANTEIAIGNRTVIDVQLQEDVRSLQEVVVVGYGTVKKSDLTRSEAV